MLLIKSGLPSKKSIWISIILSVMATVAFLGYQLNPGILIYGFSLSGIPTLFTSLAVFSVMEKQGGYELFSRKKKGGIVGSIIIALVVGFVLAIINVFMNSEPINYKFSFSGLLFSLNPAIFEEIAGRAIFMAYCVYFSHGQKMGKFSIFTMYFMMCMPHTVVHGYGLVETIILCVLFGLPFTILQCKRDIGSAMISHGIVDIVRFMVFGMPM